MAKSPDNREDTGPIPVAGPTSYLLIEYLGEAGLLDTGKAPEPNGTPEMRALKSAFRRVLKAAQKLKDPGDRAKMLREVQLLRGSLATNLGDPWADAD